MSRPEMKTVIPSMHMPTVCLSHCGVYAGLMGTHSVVTCFNRSHLGSRTHQLFHYSAHSWYGQAPNFHGLLDCWGLYEQSGRNVHPAHYLQHFRQPRIVGLLDCYSLKKRNLSLIKANDPASRNFTGGIGCAERSSPGRRAHARRHAHARRRFPPPRRVTALAES